MSLCLIIYKARISICKARSNSKCNILFICENVVWEKNTSRSHSERLAGIARVKRKLIIGNPLWLKVQDGLQQGLSPEQIAGTMSRMNEPIRLCHETIYQASYVDA